MISMGRNMWTGGPGTFGKNAIGGQLRSLLIATKGG